ncbi:stabilizer of axonemal microtubules 2 [Plectropomus leopardus]|uniref:stabilizer of axonemal microtubules 2 n=1 Tax=Plectropomus leopardus TaxID=160734 RepID=UPI001C4D46EA|nr:stabilizer of axonemal microtubules 2 [Plectropomus leopardus]
MKELNKLALTSRKQPGHQRAQTRSSMTTEYQERFLPPRCHVPVVTSSTRKDPHHALKGTSANMTTLRSSHVTHKWIKHPPKAPQPSLPPSGQQRCSSTPQNPYRSAVNQMASKVDYTSVYKNDFRAWKANKLQPFKLSDSLKVNQGLHVTDCASKESGLQKKSVQVETNSTPVPQTQILHPFESVTSYRLDYVSYPAQPRRRTEKPVYQTKGLLSEPAVSVRPKDVWDKNQEHFDPANERFQQIKTWSLETKFHSQGKAKEASPSADQDYLSTTHADYTAHKCERTKPILPSVKPRGKNKEPFQATTTMMEDYKVWNTPRRLPIVCKQQLDWPKKTIFSAKPAESCTTNPKPLSLQSAVCDSSCNTTKTPQRPVEHEAFSGLECISNGTEESRMYWTTSVDRGVTWADVGICEEPPQGHQIISCMVSSRS